jgi:N-acetylneuraminic acid mutarotase
MKDHCIRLRISYNEKAEIYKRAKISGISTSEYIRKMLLHGKVINRSELSELLYEINHIGNNINQAVKLMNTYLDVSEHDYNYIYNEFLSVKSLVEDNIK